MDLYILIIVSEGGEGWVSNPQGMLLSASGMGSESSRDPDRGMPSTLGNVMLADGGRKGFGRAGHNSLFGQCPVLGVVYCWAITPLVYGVEI